MSFSPRATRRNIYPGSRNGFSRTRRELSPSSTRDIGFINTNRTPSPNRPKRNINNDVEEISKPLLEPDTSRIPQPPLAGPEIDDLSSDDRETVIQPGVDDGFFVSDPGVEDKNPDAEELPKDPEPVLPILPETDIDVPDIATRPYPDFPYAPGYGPDYAVTEFGGVNPESLPDVNIYQHKKTLAQGMMDLALFSANANQLRYVLESYERHPYYYPSIILISFSILFQIAVGVGLIWNARYDVKDKREICIANKVNNFTVIGIFLVTVINVFVSAFGVANVQTTTNSAN